MAENVKLKDLYADEKVYDGINIVKIPKADGTGNANFIVPPTSMYMLKESSYSAAAEKSISSAADGKNKKGYSLSEREYPFSARRRAGPGAPASGRTVCRRTSRK